MIRWLFLSSLGWAGLSAAAGSVEIKDIKRDIESNLSKIKTLSCEVEIVGMMGAGSLRHTFSLEYKFPHRLRTRSLSNPTLVYISTKDSAFFKSGQPKRMDESLISVIRPDAEGRLFNPIAFLDGSQAATATACGQNVCVSFSGKAGEAVPDSLKTQLGIGKYSGSIEYSPEKKVVESFTLLAGPAVSRSKIEYQEVGGAQVPQLMEMHMQGMKTTIRFDKVRINQPIQDETFK